MKAGAFLLALLWFSGSVYAGYRLTERSFAWIAVPNFGLTVPAVSDIGAAKAGLPSVSPALLDQFKNLSPATLACLRVTIAPDRIQAALQGQLTPQETAAAAKCFK